MSGLLEAGARLTTPAGEEVTVTGLIGAGGQGEVYRVRHRNTDMALKWYYSDQATPLQQTIVEDLIARRFADDRFLWPRDLVTGPGGGFGYLMALRPDNFCGLAALFSRQVRIRPREMLAACTHLVEAYRALHSQGIAYRDISQGNVFMDPVNGDVLVCDNDNAIVEGREAGIDGTMDFMAPELVRGDPGATPSTQTDLHSLAVLLFMMLMNHHPFLGALEYRIRCLDEKAKLQLLGKDPVFIFDPDDARNRPVRGAHDTVLATWDAAPPLLHGLFTAAFTSGVRQPETRVRETQWRDALSSAYDFVLTCRRCAGQIMIDPVQAASRPCWRCGEIPAVPAALDVTTADPRVTHRVLLDRGARVFGHHLHPDAARHDFTAAVASVVEHPRVPGRLGLQNMTPASWKARRPDGSAADVPPGKRIDITEGTVLRIGTAEAAIRPAAPR